MEDRIKLLLMSYSLEEILEECNIEEEWVLLWLHQRGTININDFFEDDLEEDEEEDDYER